MLFTDPFFLVFFLPVTILSFYAASKVWGPEGGRAVLFIASCAFYSAWGLWFFAVMMAGTVVNFAVCQALILLPDERRTARNTWFWLGQSYNFGTLFYFKYAGYLALLPSGGGPHSLLTAAIPIGISFYTFQQAVLIADAFARTKSATSYLESDGSFRSLLRSFVRFGSFHCFFPQLVVGPITYISEFAPQALSSRFGKMRATDFEVGITLLVIGLFKKLALADSLGLIVDPAFTALSKGHMLTPAQAWAAALAFFVQLYFDFSGYSDMALGAARFFGIRLPVNFASPLRASSIVDFYRRWHITLTRVIGRFLFTPLSVWGTRFAVQRNLGPWPRRLLSVWIPLLANFEVIALWHGALPTYVLFGLVHGAWFVLDSEVRATTAWKTYKKQTSGRTRRIRGQIVTVLPLMLTFALFRSDSIDTFATLTRSMFYGSALELPGLKDNIDAWPLIAVALAVVWFLPNSVEFVRRYRPGILTWSEPSTTPALARFSWRPSAAWGMAICVLAIVSLHYINREAPFIYMGF